jgi:NDP-sugar pyrophosphorylase family protein
MKIIITLSGKSERFTKDGYPEKSFIKVVNKYMIEHVINMFDGISHDNIYLITKNCNVASNKILQKLFPKININPISPNSDGPVVSILSADLDINPEEEIIVSYCDLVSIFNLDKLISYVHTNNADGCILTHCGLHPHKFYNTNFAHVRHDSNNNVLEIKEKGCFTAHPIFEHASNGIYYFKSFQMMNHYFRKLIESGNRVNNEFYVTMPYNLIINDNLKILMYETEEYICLGTPKDVELVNAWNDIITKSNIDKDEDFVMVYNYWKKIFNDKFYSTN